ncbi:TolC family protein [Luteitalea sp.]
MRGLSIVLFCTFVCSSAFAQAPVPERLTLEEALRLAAVRNPQASGARALVSAAEADQLQARLRPNPALSVEMEGYPLFESPRPSFQDNQETTIRVDQELEMGGRRRLRREVASLRLDSARLTQRDRLRQLELSVKSAYLELVLAQVDAEVAHSLLGSIDQVLKVSTERARVGEIARIEVRRLDVEQLRFAEDAFAADLALRNARSSLLALVGAEDLNQPLEATDPLAAPGATVHRPSPTVPNRTATGEALTARPDFLAARTDLDRAGTETRLQRALRSPNVTLGAGYRRNFGADGVVFGVSIPLPFWDRNQGGIARAEAERSVAESNLKAVELTAQLEIQRAAHAVETNRQRMEYIEARGLASAKDARDVVSESYRLGAATLLDFLDAQRAFRDTQRLYNRALFEYRLSLFELDAARGMSSIAQ